MDVARLNVGERRVSGDRRGRFAVVGPAVQERRTLTRRGGTRLSRDVVMRTVEHIAKEIDVRLTVVGVVGGKARSNYVEVLLGIQGCEDEPCRATIGVNRLASPDEIRSAIRKPLEAYLRRHTH